MNKKIYFVLSLLLVATLAFTACAPKEETATEAAPAEEATSEEAAPAGEDTFKVAMLTDLGGLAASEEVKGFSDLGWDACLRAKEELGAEATFLAAKELADLEQNLTKMASEGY